MNERGMNVWRIIERYNPMIKCYQFKDYPNDWFPEDQFLVVNYHHLLNKGVATEEFKQALKEIFEPVLLQ